MCCRLLVLTLLLAYAVPAKPRKGPITQKPLSLEEQQLIEARRGNEQAQAEFYREQTLRLRNPTPSPSKTFQQSMAENPASVLGVIGVIVAGLFAALVGLLTLFVNNRALVRSHIDTQFYNALKLFGDKNGAVRSSAAGILGRMANIEMTEFNLRHPIHSLLNKKQPYYGVAHNQLIIGFLSEVETSSLLQIRRAIYQIVYSKPSGLATMLINANSRLQTELRRALADFFIARGAPDSSSISDDLWKKIPQNIYQHHVFKYLVNYDSQFSNTFEGLLLNFQVFANDEAKKTKNLASTFRNLILAAYRLNLITEIYLAVLKESPDVKTHERNDPLFLVNGNLNKLNLNRANLRKSFLAGAKLQDTNLESAELRQAWLDNADITDARLAHAHIDTTTSMTNVNWWKANYYVDSEKHVDSVLLRHLMERDGANLEKNQADVHPSVQDFLITEHSKDVGTPTV